MRECDLAWAAGFFDGEGCVVIHTPTPGRSGSIRAMASNTSLIALERLRTLFGGSVRSYILTRTGHVYYSWQVGSKVAETFFLAIRPYAVIKGEQIDIALAYHVRRPGRHRRRTTEEIHYDDAAVRALKRLRVVA